MPKQSYWSDTRAPRYSLLFALPLLLGYELLAASLAAPGGGVRNGADAVLRMLALGTLGERGSAILGGVVILACLAWVVRDLRKDPGGLRIGYFPLMFLESAALSVVFAVVVSVATAQLLTQLGAPLMIPALAGPGGSAQAVQQMGRAAALMLSLGAGLYEELLFRVILVTAFAAGARVVLGAGQLLAGILAAVASALIFSAFHYIGAYGDTFTVQSFTFRAIAGLAFSGLYLLRGFGITAWTHALYDIGVMVL
ncbi:MAG: CPBP family intramembrane glutamic endopeptidase [Gemmatimonadaceae bacterium]